MQHEHEPIITTNGLIKCRTCGNLLEEAREEIAAVDSRVKANRILSQMAVEGRYTASSFESGFVVYIRERNGVTEELTGEKFSDREYKVIKRFITKETKYEIGRR